MGGAVVLGEDRPGVIRAPSASPEAGGADVSAH